MEKEIIISNISIIIKNEKEKKKEEEDIIVIETKSCYFNQLKFYVLQYLLICVFLILLLFEIYCIHYLVLSF